MGFNYTSDNKCIVLTWVYQDVITMIQNLRFVFSKYIKRFKKKLKRLHWYNLNEYYFVRFIWNQVCITLYKKWDKKIVILRDSYQQSILNKPIKVVFDVKVYWKFFFIWSYRRNFYVSFPADQIKSRIN